MKTGFYKSKTRDTIYFVYRNHEEDSKEYPWLVSTFEYESTIDGLKRYEDESGNDVALQFLEDEFDETPLKFRWTTIVNENDAIIEKKLTYKQKLDKILKYLGTSCSETAIDIRNIINS